MPSCASSVPSASANDCRSYSTPSWREPSNARLTASFASRSANGLFSAIVAREPLRLVEPRLPRHDARHEPGRVRLVRGKEASRQDHVHRHRLADRAREPLRAARARHEPEVDLRLAELGASRRPRSGRRASPARNRRRGRSLTPPRRSASRPCGSSPSGRGGRKSPLRTGLSGRARSMSAPAANARSEPPRTMQRISPSSSSSRSAPTSSFISSSESAFSCFGRFSRTTAIGGSRSTRTSWSLIRHTPSTVPGTIEGGRGLKSSLTFARGSL